MIPPIAAVSARRSTEDECPPADGTSPARRVHGWPLAGPVRSPADPGRARPRPAHAASRSTKAKPLRIIGSQEGTAMISDELKLYFRTIGRKGGQARSAIKTRAARRNAKLGGRPKKRGGTR